ncbi:MAG: chemotaxis protein CheA [Planctomycetota bacterium]
MNDTITDSISQLSSLASRTQCTASELNQALTRLANVLDDANENALAFVAETAAGSCVGNTIELATARLGVVEICSRLLESLESGSPMDLAGADDILLPLLFPTDVTGPTTDVHADSQTRKASDRRRDDSVLEETAEAAGPLETCCCQDEELLREFLTEAAEHMDAAEQLMLTIERTPDDAEALNGLFRAVHSVKGSSGVLELRSLGQLSHVTESVLVRARDRDLSLTGRTFECMLYATDFIKRQVEALVNCQSSKSELQCPRPPKSLHQGLHSICDDGQCDPSLITEIRHHLSTDQESDRTSDASASSKKTTKAESMRVDSKRLEQLIDLIGELVIVETAVAQELCERDSLSAASVAGRLRKTVREVQELSLTLKMVPVGATLQKINRMVRDLSARLNKPCRLIIEGGDTEVDKTLLEQLSDPLVHLVRNSLDHGVESNVQDRLDAGKSEVATIRISAEHRAGNIVIGICDDGAGLNRDKIFARATEKGLVQPSQSLTPHEVDQLIFAPGFSTAAEVSDISGRGVGMDVVRKNVESMRGSIAIESQPGQGTQISLELPLTLSIIDGTVVRIGTRSFIIPTLSVIEQVQASTIEFSRGDTCMLGEFRGRFAVARRLGDVLATEHSAETGHGRVCVVVESGTRQQLFVVDEILGQQPVVIKPLGGILESFGFFAGGALLASGEVGFVLDLNAICNSNVGTNLNEIL